MTTAIQIIGFGAICAGAFMVALWLGLMLTGLSLITLGHFLDTGADST